MRSKIEVGGGFPRVARFAVVLVLLAAVVACRPIPLGSASSQLGNDVSACPSFHPSSSCPTPQPMVWSAIDSPYTRYQDGDPYTTKCAGDTTTSSVCSGTGPGGAQNPLYDPTGYEYAIDVGDADVGTPLTFQVWDAAQIARTVGSSATSGAFDCNRTVAPFNAFTSVVWSVFGSLQCQAGDQVNSVPAPFQVQVFDNDGVDDSIAYDTPVGGCHLYLASGATGTASTAFKNTWTTVCTFTPSTAGVYPVRIKSSGIVLPDGTAVRDVGSGFNGFALRVVGGTTTRLYATGTLPIWANAVGPSARFYLAEITRADAGKRLQIDLFDPGDGNSTTDYFIQVLAPPSGAPGLVPSGGTPIPAPGIADSCRYNPTGSLSRGPEVAAPAGREATLCRVQTRSGSISFYNGTWLSIEVDISPDYACDTDCWWTLRLDFGAGGSPSDHLVAAPLLVDRPASATTTTTTGSTTTTTMESTTTTTTELPTTTTTELATTTTTESTTTTAPPGSSVGRSRSSSPPSS